MPPTNDTGNQLVVGPDVNGDYFTVEQGEDYTLPEPPRTALDEESEATGEESASEDEGEELGSTSDHTGPPPDPEIPFEENLDGKTTTDNTEGASE